MSPLQVGFVRVAIAAPCLLLAAALAGPLRLPPPGTRWRIGAAGLAMAGYQACYFWGVTKTSVAVGALLAICSAPLMIAVLAAGVLGERLTTARALALAAGVTGAALLTAGPDGRDGGAPPGFGLGGLLALGAGACYALYAVLVKSVVGRVAPVPLAAWTFAVAALSLAPIVLGGEPVAAGAWGWALLVYLGVVPTALAYILYVVGLRAMPVTVSGVVALVEPLTATLLGVAFFGDRLGLAGALGAALLLGAVVRLARG
jgi:DME family drug/metabolite transporter